MTNLTEKVQNIVKSLLEKLGISEAEVDVSEDHGAVAVSVTSPDEDSLVGHDNDKYEAFSHLLKRILSKELGEEAKIIIDVNGMRAKREDALKAKALMVAARAREFRIDIPMDPMSSYERMLVHGALDGQVNIKTESVGEGRDRHLVIKYTE